MTATVPSKGYLRLRSEIIRTFDKAGFDYSELVNKKVNQLAKMSKYKSLGTEELYRLADSETIADCCETMLQNSKLFENLVAENRNLAQKLIDAIKKAIANLRSYFEENKLEAKTEYGQALFEAMNKVENRVQELWDKAVAEGIKATNAGVAESGSVQLSSRYAKQGGEWSKALTGAEWTKFNHAISSGADAGLRVSDNAILVECEQGNIYDYKFVIYDNSFEDIPIKSIYAIGNIDYNSITANKLAEIIFEMEDRGYGQEVLNKGLRRYAKDYQILLGKYNRNSNRYTHFGEKLNNNRADSQIESNRGGISQQLKVGKSNTKSSDRFNDTDYLSAVERGDMQTAQRMVGEAAKAAGYDMHLYHGAKSGGGFTVFKDWQYFTENKPYAERYTQRDTGKGLYNVFVKSSRMFDTRNAADREVFEQYRNEYGMGEIQENGLPDWTDGYDLSEIIEENNLDYDGIILDEGGDLVNGKPVSRGVSYVIRNSSQIKSADPVTYDDNGNVIPLSERFNTEEKDIRYSDRANSDYFDELLDMGEDLF